MGKLAKVVKNARDPARRAVSQGDKEIRKGRRSAWEGGGTERLFRCIDR